MTSKVIMTSLALALAGAPSSALADPDCKPAEPALTKGAKVTCEQARKAALARVPGGKVLEGELEKEHGKLIFSFDIQQPGATGVEEVEVDAVTGKVIAQHHEDADAEAKEKAEEAKEKARSKGH
jgi:peptidase YpeB-like protein